MVIGETSVIGSHVKLYQGVVARSRRSLAGGQQLKGRQAAPDHRGPCDDLCGHDHHGRRNSDRRRLAPSARTSSSRTASRRIRSSSTKKSNSASSTRGSAEDWNGRARMVYLDYNATTPLAPRRSRRCCRSCEAASESVEHPRSGPRGRAAMDDARDGWRGLLGAKPHEISSPAAAPRRDNLAVLGLARAHAATRPASHHRRHRASCRAPRLRASEATEGFDVTAAGGCRGRVDPAAISRPPCARDTTLVSVMHANNETGTLQPVENLPRFAASAACSFTPMPSNFRQGTARGPRASRRGVSLAAHKFYGPKGVGRCSTCARASPSRRIAHGGSHENTRRPGTENVAAIAGMAPRRSLPRASDAPPISRVRRRCAIASGRAFAGASRRRCAMAIPLHARRIP